jgi:superfamily II DNA/RNA helicase
MDTHESDAGFEAIAGFEVTEAVARGFEQDRIRSPNAVQRAAIAPILQGHDVVVQSGTGTGKTLAYLLPVLQRLRQLPATRAVCFAPATELALQTLRVAERYKDASISAAALVSGGNQARVQKSTRLIVGTTGRILEMFEARKLKGVTMMVLDEPEPILTSRDAAFLREVLSRPEPKVQLVLAGATFGQQSERLIAERMAKDHVRTQVEAAPLQTSISHHLVRVRESDKDYRLSLLLDEIGGERAIVFFSEPHKLRHVYRVLTDRRLKPVTVSPDRSKLDCQQALARFRSSEARVLLTTDRSAVGLDIPDVPWVFHYELPGSPEAYVHRAGRTGRAGKSGRSVVLTSDEERLQLKRLEQGLSLVFEPLDVTKRRVR